MQVGVQTVLVFLMKKGKTNYFPSTMALKNIFSIIRGMLMIQVKIYCGYFFVFILSVPWKGMYWHTGALKYYVHTCTLKLGDRLTTRCFGKLQSILEKPWRYIFFLWKMQGNLSNDSLYTLFYCYFFGRHITVGKSTSSKKPEKRSAFRSTQTNTCELLLWGEDVKLTI